MTILNRIYSDYKLKQKRLQSVYGICFLGIMPAEKMNAVEQYFTKKMTEFKMDPQAITDGINMEKGTCPLRFPIEDIAQGTDHEFIKARAEIKAKWLAAYND